jgi:hypothetical protein
MKFITEPVKVKYFPNADKLNKRRYSGKNSASYLNNLGKIIKE